MMRDIVMWAVVVVATRPHVAVQAASVCAVSGLPAPAVGTLLASARSPASEAVVVWPDCSSDKITATRGQTLSVSERSIQRVASLPSVTTQIMLKAELSEGGDFTAARELQTLSIESATASAKDFAFPGLLKSLAFKNTQLSDLELLKIPSGVASVTLRDNHSLKSLKKLTLPSSVSTLDLSNNALSTIDFALPEKLQSIDLSGNPITTIYGTRLPDSLVHFVCDQCEIRSLRGLKLPRQLSTLKLGIQEVTTFEVRESDVAVLQLLASSGTLSPPIRQSTCSDAMARAIAIKQGTVCVISDARFEELYNGGPSDFSPSNTPSAGGPPNTVDKVPRPFTRAPSTTDSASSSYFSIEEIAATTAVSAQPPAASEPAPNASQYDRSMAGETQGKPTVESGVSETHSISSASSNLRDGDGPNPSPLKGQASEKKTTTSSTTSDVSSNSFVIVLAAVGTVLLLAMGVVGYRVRAGARRKHDAAAYENLESPLPLDYAMIEPRDPTPATEEDADKYLEHDIRIDPTLQAYRLNAVAIQLGDAVTQGGAYVLYRGVFRGQTVAVKQMAQDTWRDEANVARFMDEIRICLSLHHPQLVRCLGMSWTSVRDLSVVTEYMAGGDLRAFLESQSGEPTGREWSESWSVSRIKSKTSIATDVAQALAHLHTREMPILHRDLRAKLVLLDLPGNAKLSGFGIGRLGTVDEAASREAGAVAWIAPEVLRGERFTAKADIYSFGVLLVELDRCRHPYAHEPVLASHEKNARTTTMMRNTRIAIMVSTGKLRPSPSPSCPDRVKQVILRCLALHAADRPTAMEVADTLNAIGREIGAK